MTDKPTVLDVLDRMRESAGEDPQVSDPGLLRYWADHIELAWRRERDARTVDNAGPSLRDQLAQHLESIR